MRHQVGNGQRTDFWEDSWCGNMPFKHEFLMAFSLAAGPLAKVAEYITQSQG